MVISVGRLAQIFHDSADQFLSEQGFELAEDPTVLRNPYCATAATYRSKRGLFLRIGFEPLDGRSAGISFGRRWRLAHRRAYNGQEAYRLSAPFAALANLLGISMPYGYELHPGDAFLDDVAEILGDLERGLPEIMQKLTIDDLIKVEAQRFGVQDWLKTLSQDDSALVIVDDYREDEE